MTRTQRDFASKLPEGVHHNYLKNKTKVLLQYIDEGKTLDWKLIRATHARGGLIASPTASLSRHRACVRNESFEEKTPSNYKHENMGASSRSLYSLGADGKHMNRP